MILELITMQVYDFVKLWRSKDF